MTKCRMVIVPQEGTEREIKFTSRSLDQILSHTERLISFLTKRGLYFVEVYANETLLFVRFSH